MEILCACVCLTRDAESPAWLIFPKVMRKIWHLTGTGILPQPSR